MPLQWNILNQLRITSNVVAFITSTARQPSDSNNSKEVKTDYDVAQALEIK